MFNRIFISLCASLCLALPYSVQANCFVLKALGASAPAISEGECSERVSPCSTFKIPLALMGFENKILIDLKTPRWPFKPEYEHAYHVCLDKWKEPQTPVSWMKNSCIWYSQVITQTLGADKFKQFVELFNYGNQDISGDPGKNNGLTHAWLSSSLKISPVEQIDFISKILADSLPVSTNAVELTKQILYLEDLDKNWKLYGKTGSGYQINKDGTYNKDRQNGWFVGWVSNPSEDKHYMFAYYLQDKSPERVVAGLRAKEQAIKKIKAFLKKSA